MKTGIVDDSGFMRLVLKKIVSNIDNLEYIWDASDGQEAIEKNFSNPADIIISDMEMPNMDGLDLIKTLRDKNQNVECIIVSGQHESGAPKIIEAIRLGAVGFVSKNDESGQSNLETMGSALNEITKSIVKKYQSTKIYKKHYKINNSFKPSKVLVIAGSAGSLDPLSEVFNELSDPFVPIVVAIHIPKKMETHLVSRLNQTAIKNNQKMEFGVFDSLKTGRISIAPGGFNTVFKKSKLTDNKILLRTEDASKNQYGFTPSIDKLLESAVKYNVICDVILLSGLGEDGSKGCKLQASNGGNILVQLPDTAIASSMPTATLNSCKVMLCDSPKNLALKIRESWKYN
tara:strand:- start:1267 stop:2301 length:1035 start_codon:yes stop_codon:yes gene_type:complete